ncbi:MAG: type II secretion system major pseudopilin GspG [Verrucomicrobiota bacterium]
MRNLPSLQPLRRACRRAFTLIEIMIVLVILSLLVGLAAYSLTGFTEQGEDLKIKSDLNIYEIQLQMYRANAGRYPTTAQGLKALHAKPTSEPVPAKWRQLMKDLAKDPWQQDYQYAYPGKQNPGSFDLWSLGPDPDDPSDDVGNWQ